MKKFYNCGIDTICLIVDTRHSNEEIDRLKTKHPVLKTVNDLSLTKDGVYKKIIFQPSNYIDRTRLLNNGSIFLNCITESLDILEGEVISVNRIDISVDSKKVLDDYKQLARLVVLCAATKKNIRKAFTVKNLFDLKEKTVKLNSDRFVITFYCREDQTHHEAVSRLEIRYQKLSQAKLEVEAENRIKNTIDLFTNLEDTFGKVEKLIIPILIKRYHDEIQSGLLATFSGFMDKYGEFIYTKEIFDEVYRKSGKIGAENKWLEKFRKTRPNALSFNSKNSIKEFSTEIKKNLKEYMKTI